MGSFGDMLKAFIGNEFTGSREVNTRITFLVKDCERGLTGYRLTRRLVDEAIRNAECGATNEKKVFTLSPDLETALASLKRKYEKDGLKVFRSSEASWKKVLVDAGLVDASFEYQPDSAELNVRVQDEKGKPCALKVMPICKYGSVCNASEYSYDCAFKGLVQALSMLDFIGRSAEEVASVLESVGFKNVNVRDAEEDFFSASVRYDLTSAFVLSAHMERRNVSKEIDLEQKDEEGRALKVDFDCMEGHDFEAFCAVLLEANGFSDVGLTRGSGDQGIDILATRDCVRYGIQCKRYSEDVGNKAVQEAYAGKTFYGCHVAVVLTNRGFTGSAVELANRIGVVLWDRSRILEMIGRAEG